MVIKCFGRLRHLSQAGEALNLDLLEQPMWWATSSRLVKSEVNKHVFRPFHGLSRGTPMRSSSIKSRQATAAVNLQLPWAGAGWGGLEMQRYPHGARS